MDEEQQEGVYVEESALERPGSHGSRHSVASRAAGLPTGETQHQDLIPDRFWEVIWYLITKPGGVQGIDFG